MTKLESRAPERRLGRPPLAVNQEDAIVSAASELFARKGYEAATLNDVCDSLGLSKAAIYHYFASKSALYDRVILKTLKRMADRLDEAVANEITPAAKLKALVIAQCAFLETDAFGMVVVFEATKMMNKDLGREGFAFMDGYEALIGSLIEGGIKDGSFADVDVDVTRKLIIGMLSWMAKWFDPKGDVKARDIADRFLQILMHGIGSKGND